MGAQNKKKKEIFNPNPKGYIHGALILKNTLYAFFGPDENRPVAVALVLLSRCTPMASRLANGKSGQTATCPLLGIALD